jgi:hypothetical protein
VEEVEEGTEAPRGVMLDKAHYLRLRNEYEPKHPRLIFVAESPPASGKYFYDPSGRKTEPLFAATMRLVLSSPPQSIVNGLDAFRDSGYVLVDATYQPVNKGLSNRQREEIILGDYSPLKMDLLSLTPQQDIPILLVKANVCRLLEPRLLQDGFKVINEGIVIPFPSTGNQKVFQTRIEPLLRSIE